MKLNKYPYRIKIDDEIKSNIEFLRKNKIKVSHIIRETIRKPLLDKCIEFKLELTKEILPF